MVAGITVRVVSKMGKDDHLMIKVDIQSVLSTACYAHVLINNGLAI